jgi:hypothetical protein
VPSAATYQTVNFEPKTKACLANGFTTKMSKKVKPISGNNLADLAKTEA